MFIAEIKSWIIKKAGPCGDHVLWNQTFIYHNNLISFTGAHRKTPSGVGGVVSVEKGLIAAAAVAAA